MQKIDSTGITYDAVVEKRLVTWAGKSCTNEHEEKVTLGEGIWS